MQWRHAIALSLGLVAFLVFLLGDDAIAQSWNQRYAAQQRAYETQMMMLRIITMGGATGLGFLLGWLLSPAGKNLRLILLLSAAGIAVLVAVLDDGVLGWSTAMLLATIGFFFGLGYWAASAVRALADVPTTFGSARWASVEHMAEEGVFKPHGLCLGQVDPHEQDTKIHYNGDRHLLTVAPTRSGKGTCHIVPNLLGYQGSALVIDPKGENALITAKARATMGQAIHICDPWNIASDAGFGTARFNPLDWLQLGDVDITENAMLLADALVVEGDHRDRFWAEESKALLQGYLLYVATDPREQDERHLGRVRDLLLLDGEDQKALFEHMMGSPHHIVASTGARCLQKEPKLLANVMASAQAQTHFLDSARIRENLTASDFAFEDLKDEAITIYLVLPADRLETFGRWLRLMVQQAITVNARNIEKTPKKPVLFILDEMPALGRLSMVEQAYGLMAGFGFQIWGIVQDLGQLKGVYGDRHESFIANSGVVAYFGSPDCLTADYISNMCGVTTVWNFSSALSTAFSSSTGGSGGTSRSNSETDTRSASQRKLIYPDELMRLNRKRQIILMDGVDPIPGWKSPWFNDPKLKKKGRSLRSS